MFIRAKNSNDKKIFKIFKKQTFTKLYEKLMVFLILGSMFIFT